MSEFFIILGLKSPYIPLSTIFFLNKLVISQDLGLKLFFLRFCHYLGARCDCHLNATFVYRCLRGATFICVRVNEQSIFNHQ